MSCYECHKVQEIALNKNNPNTVGIAYIRVEEACYAPKESPHMPIEDFKKIIDKITLPGWALHLVYVQVII